MVRLLDPLYPPIGIGRSLPDKDQLTFDGDVFSSVPSDLISPISLLARRTICVSCRGLPALRRAWGLDAKM